jgi:hypothetical protein
VVFGRFSQPPPAALGLAGLVLAGGCAQVLFLGIVRWPSPLRAQRAATAAAYRALSGLAVASADVSTLPAAVALDDAGSTLSSPTLFGDPALMTLRILVNEGHRMRVQLSAIHALISRQLDVSALGAASGQAVGQMLELTAAGLELAARAIGGDRSAAAALPQRVAELSSEAAGLDPGPPTTELEPASLRASSTQLHMSRQLPVQRGYWLVVAAATVLRPEFAATFTRGTERALGACLGVALAGAIAVGLHPAGGVTVVIVGLLAWAGYATFPASFAVGFGCITAVVVFLLDTISPDTLATAEARLLDTLVGGTIGLLAYALVADLVTGVGTPVASRPRGRAARIR